MWIPKAVWQEFLAEHKQLRERVDRLTEAVARERGMAVQLPQTQPRKPSERSSGWFDNPFNPLQEKKQ